jgi:hypothetical protein
MRRAGWESTFKTATENEALRSAVLDLRVEMIQRDQVFGGLVKSYFKLRTRAEALEQLVFRPHPGGRRPQPLAKQGKRSRQIRAAAARRRALEEERRRSSAGVSLAGLEGLPSPGDVLNELAWPDGRTINGDPLPPKGGKAK